MIATIPQIIAAVRATLQDLVLPDLPADSWTAGGIRSSLTLLTYVEDALMLGPDAMGDGIAAMEAYFSALVAQPGVTFVDEATRTRVKLVLREGLGPCPNNFEDLQNRHRVLKQLLSDLIARSVEHGRTSGEHDRRAVLELRQCLRELSAAENRLAQRAGAMPPF